MKLFVSDQIFNIENIYSYNGQLLIQVLNHNVEECAIVFLMDDIKNIMFMNDYLNSINNVLIIDFWKKTLIDLEKYKIILCNKYHIKNYIEENKITEVNYFCNKKNILYEDIDVIKNIFLKDSDVVEEKDYQYFNKLYTFNNIDSNEKVEFIQFQPISINEDIRQIETKTKQDYRFEKNITINDVVFIHVIDINMNIIDRIIFALDKLKEKNIFTILYLPILYNLTLIEKMGNLKKIDNNKMIYNYYNNEYIIEKEDTNVDDNLKIKINLNFINNKENFSGIHNFCKDYLINYEFKFKYMNEFELNKYIYLSDVYIPIANDFTGLSITSQKYKTYTLFTDDGKNSNEYCLYGDNLLKNSNDYYFNVEELKIKKNLKTNDVYETLKLFFEKKEDPFFVYNKEICNILYHITTFDNFISNIDTYETKYGKISLYKNEIVINENSFKENKYWDENSLLLLKKYIDPNKNILEIGGHCGTSTILYSSFLEENSKIYVFEPQNKMFRLLKRNIEQNNLQNKIIATNKGVFCYNGKGFMSNSDLDNGYKMIEVCERNMKCNYGGLSLGKDGEVIELITLDSLNLDNIGFIHCHAQGSENFIFSNGINLITKNRPIIYYENNESYCEHFYDEVCANYPEYKEEAKFDIKKYCIETLGYKMCINNFNGGIDDLLIP